MAALGSQMVINFVQNPSTAPSSGLIQLLSEDEDDEIDHFLTFGSAADKKSCLNQALRSFQSFRNDQSWI